DLGPDGANGLYPGLPLFTRGDAFRCGKSSGNFSHTHHTWDDRSRECDKSLWVTNSSLDGPVGSVSGNRGATCGYSTHFRHRSRRGHGTEREGDETSDA